MCLRLEEAYHLQALLRMAQVRCNISENPGMRAAPAHFLPCRLGGDISIVGLTTLHQSLDRQ